MSRSILRFLSRAMGITPRFYPAGLSGPCGRLYSPFSNDPWRMARRARPIAPSGFLQVAESAFSGGIGQPPGVAWVSDSKAGGRIMKRFLTLVCVLACLTATNARSRRTANTFGDWSAPVNAGPALNPEYNDNYAILSRDALTIYFTSDRPVGGLGGDDLWFATRESLDAPWDEPQNMGAPI